jgi:16S rRNA (adenine1518-N6/adenine1519-N6)-dimethyltransferase
MTDYQHSALSTQHSARKRLSALGLRPSKRLSQSFLEDQGIASAIVRAAKVDACTEVLEVGPGLGVLTERLATAARRVVAVELDVTLAEWLQSELPTVTVVNEDVLKFEPSGFFECPFVVVANLPYHITSPALRHLLAVGPPFASRLIVMVQAEVAERIAAPVGQLSALAVATQAQARVRIVRRVPASAFYPRPKVDSALLSVQPIGDADRLISRAELTDFVTLVQAGFKQPRKKILNSLSEGLQAERTVALELLDRAGIDAARRPQELDVADWIRLFRAT